MTEVRIELGKFGEADAYLRKAEQKVAPNETDNLEEIERLRQKLQEAQSGGG